MTTQSLGRLGMVPRLTAGEFVPMREEYSRPLRSWTLSHDFAEALRAFVEEKGYSR
jgi:hypothetical protein